jgi:glucuronoarabinoxylan endo-1,4-beta-xylanase
MKKVLHSTLFFSAIIHLLFLSNVYCQTTSIGGRITSGRFPIRSASVTFIDNADTTRKLTALTDGSGNYQIGPVTSIEPHDNIRPTTFELGQNYPNPFSSSTAIPYELSKESHIQVTIFDVLGRVVRKFDGQEHSAGLHNVVWDGRNNFGHRVAMGTYFYRLDANGESLVRKMIFNKGNGIGVVSLPGTFSSSQSFSRIAFVQNSQRAVYTARIENTGTTLPVIVPIEFPNIVIEHDTTINFNVDYLPVATIALDSTRQTIRGFGAANILPWRPDMTTSEIETVFGTGEGQLGFTILRLMIQPDSNQWSMNVASAKKAIEKGAIVFASPWNAPPALTEVVNGQTRVRYSMYTNYAEHLNAFHAFMSRNGAPMYAVSVQNEPDYAQDWTGWTPSEMLTFMKESASAIRTRVIAPESFQFRRAMTDPILNDSVACANLDIVGGHIYGAGLGSYPLAEQKGKEIWMTEHLSGETSQANDLGWSLSAAKEISDVMSAGMNAYVWWYVVRFYGPVSDGTEGGGNKGDVTKKGYMMSQFARFVRPGYYRVESSVYPSLGSASTTAYKDPASSKVVVVAVNTGSTQVKQVFRMQQGTKVVSLTPYTTSGSKNCLRGDVFSVTSGTFTYTLEPSSVTTFLSN